MQIQQLYTDVTNRIIAELEACVIPWTKPWKSNSRGGIMPQNFATGRAYHGINIPILWDSAARQGYPSHQWITFKQAQALNANVRKGERATSVVFTRKLNVKDKETEEDKLISMLKTFSVFNVAQIDGLKEPEALPEVSEVKRLTAVDALIAQVNPTIHYGGDIACFVPSKDFINMPPFESFKTPEGFYATCLHELTHWSGGKPRLDRDLTGRFGTHSYAAEELVAELGAAFLCAHLSIEGDLRHAGYIKNWLELLRSDPRAIFTAASKASQAADYLIAFTQSDEEQEAA